MTAIKKLYDAANVALDVIDDEAAKGFPEPDWAHQLRNAIAEMTPPDSNPRGDRLAAIHPYVRSGNRSNANGRAGNAAEILQRGGRGFTN